MITSDKEAVDGCTHLVVIDLGSEEQTSLTSDEQAIDGCTYRIVAGSGSDKATLTINSDTFALLLVAWRRMENQRGRRLQLKTVFDEILLWYLRDQPRRVNPTDRMSS